MILGDYTCVIFTSLCSQQDLEDFALMPVSFRQSHKEQEARQHLYTCSLQIKRINKSHEVLRDSQSSRQCEN